MRYLTVDGYFDGTGIRDAANGGYLEHDEVGISPDSFETDRCVVGAILEGVHKGISRSG